MHQVNLPHRVKSACGEVAHDAGLLNPGALLF